MPINEHVIGFGAVQDGSTETADIDFSAIIIKIETRSFLPLDSSFTKSQKEVENGKDASVSVQVVTECGQLHTFGSCKVLNFL